MDNKIEALNVVLTLRVAVDARHPNKPMHHVLPFTPLFLEILFKPHSLAIFKILKNTKE